MIVSGAQHSESVIYIHVSIPFQILFLFRLLHNIEQPSLCYTVDPCWLSTLFIFEIILFVYLTFSCAGSSLLHAGFSPVAASGGYSLVAVHRLLITVASVVVVQELQSTDSIAVVHRLTVAWHVGSFQTRD